VFLVEAGRVMPKYDGVPILDRVADYYWPPEAAPKKKAATATTDTRDDG
jgi:hypothetical protein